MKLQPMPEFASKGLPPCITGIGLPDRSPPLLLCRQVTSAARDFYQSEASGYGPWERTTWPATSRVDLTEAESGKRYDSWRAWDEPTYMLSILTHSHLSSRGEYWFSLA